jgi:phosphoglycolate phosphatase
MNIKAVLFDLDGTIIDPREGIINSILYAVKEFGLAEPQPETLNCFIGPPLQHSFKKRYQLSDEDAMEMVRIYRVYYADKGIFECHLYDEIEELLQQLFDKNIFLSLATSKPVIFADQLMKHFQLDKYIEFTAGALMDGKRTDKKEVIQFALENIPPFKNDEILMLGDREFDIDGGKFYQLKTAWAKWGYGVEEVLIKSEPDVILNAPLELLSII